MARDYKSLFAARGACAEIYLALPEPVSFARICVGVLLEMRTRNRRCFDRPALCARARYWTPLDSGDNSSAALGTAVSRDERLLREIEHSAVPLTGDDPLARICALRG